MRRWAFLFSLLAALSGPPLRQAESAADQSRAVAELFQAADIEVPDGGVGDDSGDGILTASHGPAVDVASGIDPLFLPAPATAVPTPATEAGLRERVWWPQSPPALRHAWLQVFRF